MIWAGIVNQTIIRPLMELNWTMPTNCDFMDKTFFAWYKALSYSFKMKIVFIHDNVPSHASQLSCEFFEPKRFTGEKIMKWLPSSPDLNRIKNLWSVVKIKLYEGYKIYNCKADLSESIKTTKLELEPAEVVKKKKKLKSIVYYWLILKIRVSRLKCKGFNDLCVYLFYY